VTAPDCLFCKIAAREIPAEMIYEDDQLVAIRDINPAAPVHFLLIPKVHIASLMNASPEHAEMLGSIQLLASRLALEWGGQSVYHLHYHVLGGKPMGWPPE